MEEEFNFCLHAVECAWDESSTSKSVREVCINLIKETLSEENLWNSSCGKKERL